MSLQDSGADFLRALFLCRELGAGVSRFGKTKTQRNITSALISDQWAGAGTEGDLTEMSDDLAQIASLVLKDIDTPDFPFSCEPTPEGEEVLDAIKSATYGANFTQQSLPQCVCEGSLRQARRAQDLCIAALMDAATAQNCFSLFSLAAICGCAALQARAEACVLREFSAAALDDYAGLTALSEKQLTHFLCSDALTVDFELAVFKALTDWVEADLRNRLGCFASLLARCVRFGQLSLADLTLLVDHSTLVALDREAMSLAAHAIIQYYMGTKFDSACAETSCSAPRACQRAAAAGTVQQATSLAPEQPACGMADHAHRSVFEAVLCCTHERRRCAPAPRQLDLAAASFRRLSVEGGEGEVPVLALGDANRAAPMLLSALEEPPSVCKAPAGLAVEMQLSPTRLRPPAPGKGSPSPPSMPPSAPTRRSLRW